MINTRTTKTGRRYDVRLRDPSGRVYGRTFTTKWDAETYLARPGRPPRGGLGLGPKVQVGAAFDVASMSIR